MFFRRVSMTTVLCGLLLLNTNPHIHFSHRMVIVLHLIAVSMLSSHLLCIVVTVILRSRCFYNVRKKLPGAFHLHVWKGCESTVQCMTTRVVSPFHKVERAKITGVETHFWRWAWSVHSRSVQRATDHVRKWDTRYDSCTEHGPSDRASGTCARSRTEEAS